MIIKSTATDNREKKVGLIRHYFPEKLNLSE
jgi:hypothetical protein